LRRRVIVGIVTTGITIRNIREHGGDSIAATRLAVRHLPRERVPCD
jgi:hypothetical protein